MYNQPKTAKQQLLLLLLLALVGIPFTLSASSSFITGELHVLIPDGHDPLFVVRDGAQINPVIVPKGSVDRLIPYAGYTVQMRATTPPPSSPAGPVPSSQPQAIGRHLLQSRGGVANTTDSNFVTSAIPGSKFSFVDIIEVIEPVDKEFVKNAVIGAQDITSVIYLLSFCGWRQAISETAFRAMWLNADSTPPTAYTMQNFWANCSQGLVRMTEEKQIIVEVPLPCSGSSSGSSSGSGLGQAFNFSKECRDVELFAWMNLAEEYTTNVLDIDTSGIKQRIAVLPREVFRNCPWAGVSSTGCSGSRCYTWINGVVATDLSLYMHEMGHNFGLLHSGRWDSEWETADQTCSMGSGATCYNAPHLWRMGWATPVPNGELNATNFASGTWRTFQLPYATQNLKNHIRIVPNWAPASEVDSPSPTAAKFPGFYVSLRKRERFDALASSVVPSPGRVLIHTSNATQVVNSYQKAELEAILDVDDTYRTELPFGIVVSVGSISNSTGAAVSVCRADVTQESERTGLCNDGLDNDCDGVTDDKDFDCFAASLSSPPPSPRVRRRLLRPPPKSSKPKKSTSSAPSA